MADTMKACLLTGPNEFSVQEIEKPVPGPGEILLKNAFAAFCGNDIRTIQGTNIRAAVYPRILCHEYAGIIEAMGEGLTGFEIGDKICAVPVTFCGKCYYCSVGLQNLCEDKVPSNGGFCEYTIIPAENIRRGCILKVPQQMPLDVAGLLEPMACAMDGIRRCGVKMGDTVLVVGAGTMGMLNIELCLLAGASKVIVSDLAADRRQRALDWGASRVVDPTAEDLAAVVDEETNGQGCDVTILAIGAKSLVNDLFKLTKKGGMCYLFAGFSGDTNTVIDVNLIHYKEIFVSGNSGSTLADYFLCLDLVNTGKFDLGKYITHRFPIEQFADAYKAAVDGAGLKVGIEFYKG